MIWRTVIEDESQRHDRLGDGDVAFVAQHLDALYDVAWLLPVDGGAALAVSASYETRWGGRAADLMVDARACLDAVLPTYRGPLQATLRTLTDAPVTVAVAAAAGVRWFQVRLCRLADAPVFLVRCTDVSEIAGRARRAEIASAQLQQALGAHDRELRDAARRLGQEAATRAEAERLLTQAEKLEVVGRLTPGIAHDFNNVLAILSGTLHLVQSGGVDDRQRTLITRGLSAITSASCLVKSLHSFAADHAAGVRTVDVNRVLRESEPLLRQATGAGVQLSLQLAARGSALADPNQLQMAVLNLAINARDAMPDGGLLEIVTSDVPAVDDSGPGVHIAVRDTGCGMSPDAVTRATEPFFTTKGPDRGTGLGLPMVDTFARASGGTLVLQSELGVGTTATLQLRGVPDARTEAETADADALDRSKHGDARVLVVEDDDALRPITAAYVRDLGYDVEEARSAAEALAIATRAPALHLLVSDIELPGVDGVTLATQVARLWPRVATLFVTAHATWPGVAATQVLRKPFEPATLAARILSALGRDDGDSVEATVARLIADPVLRDCYQTWWTARSRAGLPTCGDVRAALANHLGSVVVVAVLPADPPRCEVEYLGEQLRAAYATAPGVEAQVTASIHAAYAECAASGRPSYESVRYRLGAAPPVTFERVIVPCGTSAPDTVTHLIGLVAFNNLQEPSNS